MLIRPGEEPDEAMRAAVRRLLLDAAQLFDDGKGGEYPMNTVFALEKQRRHEFKHAMPTGYEAVSLWVQECHHAACQREDPSDEYGLKWNRRWKAAGCTAKAAADALRMAAQCYDEAVAAVIENSRDNPKIWEPRVSELNAMGIDPLARLAKKLNQSQEFRDMGARATLKGGSYEPGPGSSRH